MPTHTKVMGYSLGQMAMLIGLSVIFFIATTMLVKKVR